VGKHRFLTRINRKDGIGVAFENDIGLWKMVDFCEKTLFLNRKIQGSFKAMAGSISKGSKRLSGTV
jgi:hypothetical protein